MEKSLPQLIYLFQMVIFHSYVNVYQRVSGRVIIQIHSSQISSSFFSALPAARCKTSSIGGEIEGFLIGDTGTLDPQMWARAPHEKQGKNGSSNAGFAENSPFSMEDLDGFGWIWMIWMDLDGFGWIWMDLDGFGWIWMDLDGFGCISTCFPQRHIRQTSANISTVSGPGLDLTSRFPMESHHRHACRWE